MTVALVRQTVDKNVKQADGSYAPSGETRDENVAEKFAHAESRRTVAEIKAGMEEGIFLDKWAEKNAGQPPRMRAKGAAGTAGVPGAAGRPAPSAAQAPRKSLFG